MTKILLATSLLYTHSAYESEIIPYLIEAGVNMDALTLMFQDESP